MQESLWTPAYQEEILGFCTASLTFMIPGSSSGCLQKFQKGIENGQIRPLLREP